MSHRVERVAELIRAEVSDLLQRKLRDPRIQGLVTVTEVDVSRDLGQARIFVSVLGSEEERKAALAGLRSAQGFMRREVGKRASLRVAPQLLFELDDSIERGVRMVALINELGISDEPEGEDTGTPAEDEESSAPAGPSTPPRDGGR